MHHGPEFILAFILCVALVLGAAMKMLSRRVGVPYTIGMLLLGLGAGLVLERVPEHGRGLELLALLHHGAAIDKDLILLIFLPLLVFESAFALDVHAFRRNAGAVLVYAGPVLLIAALLTGGLMVVLTSWTWHWGWVPALVFGALISATDPVAVVALLQDLGAPKRLGLLIEGESLLNDGTSIVVFSVLLTLLTGEAELGAGAVAVEFLRVTLGGLAVGLALAMAVSWWMSRAFDAPLIEITLTLVLAYGAMLLGEGVFHVSGVIAVVTAGLWMSGPGRVYISPEVGHFLHRFWEMLAYLANTLIFFLVGLVIAVPLGHATLTTLGTLLAAFAGLVVIRFALLYAFRPLVNMVSDPVSPAQTAVMAWGGLRGAVSLALGLSVARHPLVPAELGDQVLVLTAGVVLLTILVNGSSVGWLLARLGFDETPATDRFAHHAAAALVLDRVQERVAHLSRAADLRAVDWREVTRDLEERRKEVGRSLETTRGELDELADRQRLAGVWRQMLSIERAVYWKSFSDGTLSATAARMLDHDVDVQLDRIDRGQAPRQDRTFDLPWWQRALAEWWPGQGFNRLQFDLLATRYDLVRAQEMAAAHVLHELSELKGAEGERSGVRAAYRRWSHAATHALEDMRVNLPELTQAIEAHLARRIELNLERESVEELAHEGTLPPDQADRELDDLRERLAALARAERRAELPETADLCRNAPMFAGLPDNVLDRLAVLTEERVYQPGEALFSQGDPPQYMYFVARGAASVIIESDGAEEVLAVVGSGEMIGEMGVLMGADRNATVRAVTTLTVGQVSREGLHELMDMSPELSGRVWQELALRVFDNHCRDTADFSDLSREDRLAWFGKGQVSEAGAGDQVSGEAGLVFVAKGALRSNTGAHHLAPCLVPAGEDDAFEATDHCLVVHLPVRG